MQRVLDWVLDDSSTAIQAAQIVKPRVLAAGTPLQVLITSDYKLAMGAASRRNFAASSGGVGLM